HLHSIKHSYKNSPYFEEIFPEIERIYLLKRKYLMDFLLPLIELIRNKFKTSNNFLLLSDLGIDGKKEYLLLNIAEKLGADTIVIHKQALSHLNIEVLAKRGLNLEILKYRHPVYPQLWGEFLKDLSSLDILFNLGHLAWNTVLKWQKSG
ncbi:MAG: WbqC family protein, partial [Candidatus Aminicenantes bacterium]|nr:WbqC family protein [Candidatus Aminicenantes bacterium]